MTSYLYIVNPNARNGIVKKKWPKVEEEIRKRGLDYAVEYTKAPLHAEEIAKDQAKDFDVVVGTGGDGTVHEVANGLYSTKIPFGVLPLGNGNDYATLLTLDKNFHRSLDVLENFKTVELNVGQLECDVKRYFINIAELGITSVISHMAYTQLKWIKGMLKYYILGIKSIAGFKKVPGKVTIDDSIEVKSDLILCAVGLGYRFGGGFNVLPGNRPFYDDFNICVAGDVAKWKWYYLINKVKKGTHEAIDGVNLYRGKKVEVELDDYLPVEAEGELLSEKVNQITFSFAPEKLKVVVPDSFIEQM